MDQDGDFVDGNGTLLMRSFFFFVVSLSLSLYRSVSISVSLISLASRSVCRSVGWSVVAKTYFDCFVFIICVQFFV